MRSPPGGQLGHGSTHLPVLDGWTRPPHCFHHCKHCSVCKREGQTGQLWTSAALATIWETTTTTVGTNMEEGQSEQISSNNLKPHICSQFLHSSGQTAGRAHHWGPHQTAKDRQSRNTCPVAKPSAAVSAGPSAVDLTKERMTLESALHTEASGLLHLPGPRQHSAGGGSYVYRWSRDTQDAISLSPARQLLVGVPFV